MNLKHLKIMFYTAFLGFIVRFILVCILLEQKILSNTLIMKGKKISLFVLKRESGTRTNYSHSTSQKGWLCLCFKA